MGAGTKIVKSRKKPSQRVHPVALHRFPYTLRVEAYEMALDRGLHLVRDNFHLWAIRKKDKRHVHLCHAKSYDGLWRSACNTFRQPTFDADSLPYMTGETDKQIELYDPTDGTTTTISKKDLRTRRAD